MEYRYFFFYSDKRERWISCKEDTCIEMDNKGFQVKMVIYDKKPPGIPKVVKKKKKKNNARTRRR